MISFVGSQRVLGFQWGLSWEHRRVIGQGSKWQYGDGGDKVPLQSQSPVGAVSSWWEKQKISHKLQTSAGSTQLQQNRLTWLWTNLWLVRFETCFWQISQKPELVPGWGEGFGGWRPSKERVELRSTAAIKVAIRSKQENLGIQGLETKGNASGWLLKLVLVLAAHIGWQKQNRVSLMIYWLV